MTEAVHEVPGFPDVHVRTVTRDRPLMWLRQGARDLARSPTLSLFYGVVFAVLGALIVMVAGPRPYLVTASVSGFFLVGPFLALGLYQISRRLEGGMEPGFQDSLTAWRDNYHSIGFFAAVLAFAFLFWERVSAILFALFYGRHLPSMEGVGGWVFMAGESPAFALAYVAGGAVFAGLVFALSVVAVPMLLDRRVDPVTAAVTSVRVTLDNRLTLLIWAGLIVALALVGVATLFVGLVVVMPLLGHASWHAYRDLVVPVDDTAPRG